MKQDRVRAHDEQPAQVSIAHLRNVPQPGGAEIRHRLTEDGEAWKLPHLSSCRYYPMTRGRALARIDLTTRSIRGHNTESEPDPSAATEWRGRISATQHTDAMGQKLTLDVRRPPNGPEPTQNRP